MGNVTNHAERVSSDFRKKIGSRGAIIPEGGTTGGLALSINQFCNSTIKNPNSCIYPKFLLKNKSLSYRTPEYTHTATRILVVRHLRGRVQLVFSLSEIAKYFGKCFGSRRAGKLGFSGKDCFSRELGYRGSDNSEASLRARLENSFFLSANAEIWIIFLFSQISVVWNLREWGKYPTLHITRTATRILVVRHLRGRVQLLFSLSEIAKYFGKRFGSRGAGKLGFSGKDCFSKELGYRGSDNSEASLRARENRRSNFPFSIVSFQLFEDSVIIKLNASEVKAVLDSGKMGNVSVFTLKMLKMICAARENRSKLS
ncbi:MAG: hypothetical protein U9O87_10450 [Verrucomicrobiota bacterium]|nr:hypothetical protein [Verrucomicrobiota bacterium]